MWISQGNLLSFQSLLWLAKSFSQDTGICGKGIISRVPKGQGGIGRHLKRHRGSLVSVKNRYGFEASEGQAPPVRCVSSTFCVPGFRKEGP